MEGNHLAAATLLDPRFRKLALRDPTAVQQGVKWPGASKQVSLVGPWPDHFWHWKSYNQK